MTSIAGSNGKADSNGKVEFSRNVGEKEVSRAIVRTFLEEFDRFIDTDVIILGSGPAGLIAAADLAKNGHRVAVVERNNYMGGGYWLGGYLMNKVTARDPGQRIWDEQGVRYEEFSPGLHVADGPHATSAAIKAACDAGAKFFNLTEMVDLVIREGAVRGVVVNWTPVHAMPRELTCVDPIALECKVLIDATGHQAEALTKLHEKGFLSVPGYKRLGITTSAQVNEQNTFAGHDNPAHGSMWVERSEDLIVECTSKVHDGLYVAGMSVATAFQLPRMGPTFGGVLLSGRRVAELVHRELSGERVPVTRPGEMRAEVVAPKRH